jgi:predicted lipoprotein
MNLFYTNTFKHLSLSIILLSLLACNPTEKQAFDKTAMITNITEKVILNHYQIFGKSVLQFQQQVQQFQKENTNGNLSNLQTQWIGLYSEWKKCELANFGITKDKNFMYDINFNEPRPKLIENVLIETQTIDKEYIKNLGSAAKGLPALGLLLFEKEEILLEKQNNERILAYIGMLAQDLADQSQQLYDAWKGSYANDFIKNEGNHAINTLANQLLALTDNLANKRIGKLIKQVSDSSKLDTFEKILNQKKFIINNLEVIKETFNGQEGSGFDDYLDFLNAKFTNQSLSSKINQQIDAAQKAVQEADTEDKALKAQEELKKVLILIKTDMFSALGISVSFTDADGD